jgi:sugar transferase (PEP-CTERM/EpsH1 system associated)
MMSIEQPAAVAGSSRRARPLIAHVLFRFDYGGLENGIVNVVNGLPADEFDHAIIALTEASAFRTRIRRADVQVYALNKKPGRDLRAYQRLWSLLREIKPTVVHTRNVGTLDCQLFAWLAGVPCRIHGEHGWDTHDPDGTNRKFHLIRRLFNPFTQTFVTVSDDLKQWLIERVGIPSRKVMQICNGVDTQHFRPRASAADRSLLPAGFTPSSIVIGSVTRLTQIKDPLNVVRAFLAIRGPMKAAGHDIRLALIGDGPLRGAVETAVRASAEPDAVWLAGSRDDVAALLRAMDIFVLGSQREGISNTVLEAMASGLPVVATATGGNFELVERGVTGELVPPGDSPELASAIHGYASDAARRLAHGAAGRARAERVYSLSGMMNRYAELYSMHCKRLTETA